MKATVDESGCISCGLCVETCPEVFQLNDEGVAQAVAVVDSSTEDAAKEARDNCPVSVISIED